MRVYNKLEKGLKPTSVALGYFDGIHKGHQRVISNSIYYKNEGLETVLFTFLRNPHSVLEGYKERRLITELHRNEVVLSMGIDKIYAIDFNDISALTDEEFVKKILKDVLNAKRISCGFNYHFGRGGVSGAERLNELCIMHGINVDILPSVIYMSSPISSTRIRECVSQGRMYDAYKMLGRYFSVNSAVVHGESKGRKIGIPTINQIPDENMILPARGVYASFVSINKIKYYGVTNFGVRPTFDGKKLVFETWLPDYDGEDLYGINLNVELVEYLREERKLLNIDSLRNQILRDSQDCYNIITNIK